MPEWVVTSTSFHSGGVNGIVHFLAKLVPWLVGPIHLTQNPQRQHAPSLLGSIRGASILIFDFPMIFHAHVQFHSVFWSSFLFVLLFRNLVGPFSRMESQTIPLFQICVWSVRFKKMTQLVQAWVADQDRLFIESAGTLLKPIFRCKSL